jgi:hypothetical protein
MVKGLRPNPGPYREDVLGGDHVISATIQVINLERGACEMNALQLCDLSRLD